jgi:hypothetical protein
MVHMTNEVCGRCTNRLASSNKHPQRLCGECQHDLGSYKDRKNSPLLREWVAAGKPRIVRPAEGNGVTAHPVPTPHPAPALPSVADIASYPTDLLVEATRILFQRRVADEIAKLVIPSAAHSP